jgi:hypothetical protein
METALLNQSLSSPLALAQQEALGAVLDKLSHASLVDALVRDLDPVTTRFRLRQVNGLD